ncbi:MAG: hypothetical protein ACPLN0_06860 [Candidatus Hydrothermia bacterium]
MIILFNCLLCIFDVVVPDSLLFKPPDSLFVERKSASFSSVTRNFEFVALNSFISYYSPHFHWETFKLPCVMRTGNGELGWEKGYISFYSKVKFKDFGHFVTLEDTSGLSMVGERLFVGMEFRNWLDYFPGKSSRRIYTYSLGYLTVGVKVRNLGIFTVAERVNKEHQFYVGLSYFSPYFTLALSLDKGGISSFAFLSRFENFRMDFSIDNDYTFGDFVSRDYFAYDAITPSRSMDSIRSLKMDLEIVPFSFSYREKRIIRELVVFDRVFEFKINTDDFKLHYAHLDSPLRLLKDTLGVEWILRQEYYDIILNWQWRNHEGSIILSDLSLKFKLFKDLNPLVKVNNLFNSGGYYLPGVKAKRRYVEIGAIFRKEI